MRPGGCREPGRQGLAAIKVGQPRTLSPWASGWGSQSQHLATGWALGRFTISPQTLFPYLTHRGLPGACPAPGPVVGMQQVDEKEETPPSPPSPPQPLWICSLPPLPLPPPSVQGRAEAGEGGVNENATALPAHVATAPCSCLLLPQDSCKHVSIY